MNKIDCYKKILKAVEGSVEVIEDRRYTDNLIYGLENRIKIQEIGKIFGIKDLPQDAKASFIKIPEKHANIMFYKEGDYYISWSDDDRQPSDEYLYCISFPTGAYIFGEHYPEEVFNDFFEELRKYNPKYSDTQNHNLYFSPETAFKIHHDFEAIYKEYAEKSSVAYKESRKEALKKQLAQLD